MVMICDRGLVVIVRPFTLGLGTPSPSPPVPARAAGPSFARPRRDREGERGAHPHLALDPDPAAVELDELPTQRQPKPSALLLRRACTDLAKLFEDGLLVLRGDANPGIAD